jgi:peptidylprolyl isomerase
MTQELRRIPRAPGAPTIPFSPSSLAVSSTLLILIAAFALAPSPSLAQEKAEESEQSTQKKQAEKRRPGSGLRPILIDEWEEEMVRRLREEEAVPEQQIAPPPDVDVPPLDGKTASSGVVHKVIAPGTGEEPARINDSVSLHYTGWTTDGVMFDSTAISDETVQYRVANLLPGLAEAVLGMVEGETRRVWVPEELGFKGETGKPAGMLVFEVQLVSIDERGLAPPPDVAAVPGHATLLESGLAYRILEPGIGTERPAPEDAVSVNFTCFYADGRLIDDTHPRGPVGFSLENTIPGFSEALPMMVRGEKRRLWVPESMANLSDPPLYEGTIVFDVELLDFFKKMDVPPDVSGIPPDAERTESGLAYKILRPGTGDRRPKFKETVVVEYGGWTRDGKMFDSSYDHGAFGRFKLDESMPLGWNEALQMMVVGERRRIWIPEELAYGGAPDRPAGMLIFEVELREIGE